MTTHVAPLTLEEALTEREFHYTGNAPCRLIEGPSGARRIIAVNVRASGRTRTWKTRPTEFRLPVKYGLYRSLAITHNDVDNYHPARRCPLRTQS